MGNLKTSIYKVCVAILCVLFSTIAHAQFAGPGGIVTPEAVSQPGADLPGPGGPLRTVADVLKNGRDDDPVILRGKLLKKLRKERYEFTDGTGTIRVEIDNEIFVKQRVDVNTVVELIGEVDKDFFESPEIDVDAMRVISNK